MKNLFTIEIDEYTDIDKLKYYMALQGFEWFYSVENKGNKCLTFIKSNNAFKKYLDKNLIDTNVILWHSDIDLNN